MRAFLSMIAFVISVPSPMPIGGAPAAASGTWASTPMIRQRSILQPVAAERSPTTERVIAESWILVPSASSTWSKLQWRSWAPGR